MNEIKTETQDGVRTLIGEAVNLAEKGPPSKLTRDIKGVNGVNNDMTLSAYVLREMIDRPPRARQIARGGTKVYQSDTSVTQFERTKEG